MLTIKNDLSLLKSSAFVFLSLSCLGNALVTATPAIAAPVTATPLAATPLAATPAATDDLQSLPVIFNDPTPPNQGSPGGRRHGGASRGPCRQFEALTALVPIQQNIVWGQTARERPSFWFHLPAALTEQTPIEFVVQDAADNYVYNTRFTAPGTQPGLIKVAMPATAKPLAANQPYFWTLSVYCNPGKPSEAVFVKGMVQRVAVTKTTPKQTPSPKSLEPARLAAANGLWYDALDLLADLYQPKPRDRALASTWAGLLKQAGLGNLTTIPFSPILTR